MNKSNQGPQFDAQRWAILAVVVVIHLAACAVIVPFVPDDSYISFRYAENAADGNGLRYNGSDEPVEAYSNFLWIMMCAVIDAMGFALPSAAPVVGGLFGVLTLGLLWYLFIRRGIGPLQMLLPLLLVATAGPLVIYTISGLETSFFSFLLLLTLVAYDHCRENGRIVDAIGLGFVGFLAALCRPEGVVAFPAVVATALIAQRSQSKEHRTLKPWLIGLAVFAALYAVYTVWRVNYFGGFFPTPFLSKGVGSDVFVKWVDNLDRYFVMQGYEFPPLGYYFGAFVVLAVLAMRNIKDKGSVESVAFVLGLVFIAVYFNFLDWMPGMRYHAGLIPLFFLPIAHLEGHVFAEAHNRVWKRRYALVVAVLLLVNLSVLMQLRISAKRLERGNELCLKAVAEWIRTYTPADWRIAMSDVGAVPYYSQRYTIDIHPESLTDLNIARNGWDQEYVIDKRPEIVLLVARGVFSPKLYPEHFAMAQAPRFAALYRFLGTVRFDYFEDRSYWMFVPHDWPLLDDEAYDAFPPGIGSMRRLER